ncbi:helix-turn-helix transcriptional regulator [Natrinema salaciae]|uniref:MarR family protein n=1 Tax=Natrinema salaciae TaxID=1186196 RepID=A0A1H9LFL1_9EURY|nr:MarR family transcriptional regulator [Natrinema salaciae]SER09713.1 MarR family protein [Natrinema salaciae]
MDLRALHGKQLVAAAVFVVAAIVLAIQLITPTPLMVSVGQNGTETTQVGEYFTFRDVSVVTVSGYLLGLSTMYLVRESVGQSLPMREQPRDQPSEPVPGPSPQAPADAASETADEDGEERGDLLAEHAARLKDNEEVVFALVVNADGEIEQRRIVEETDLSKATVSRTLDTLESKGLVERKRHGMGNVVALQTA